MPCGGVIPSLEEKTWKEFSIADIFDIKAGKRLTTADMDSGNLPFIGATELNNGVTNWINTPNETLDHNVLGVNYNGSVAEAFYHPYSCVFSDDVKRLHLKNADDGKHILLFCSMLIRKQKVKYTYGYKFNGNRMAKQKILLPITDDGSPDYEYMTQYSKAVMFGKYKKYLEYQNCLTP
ncbi:MAG: restriction endonuclease subunit S [Clostridia bacterium]|nr:restriction endonuclease subunit S [Clostridia bacterium]